MASYGIAAHDGDPHTTRTRTNDDDDTMALLLLIHTPFLAFYSPGVRGGVFGFLSFKRRGKCFVVFSSLAHTGQNINPSAVGAHQL